MKRSVNVKTHAEGDALVRSMEDPTMRAAIVIGGVLRELPTATQRTVLAFVQATLPQDAIPMPAIEAGNGRPLGRLRDGAAGSSAE